MLEFFILSNEWPPVSGCSRKALPLLQKLYALAFYALKHLYLTFLYTHIILSDKHMFGKGFFYY